MNMATVEFDIPDDEAEALEKMCKRICYAEMEAIMVEPTEIKALERGLWLLRQALWRTG